MSMISQAHDASDPEVLQVLTDARTTNSMIVAALSVVAWDHLITFQDEVEHMWKSSWHTTNVVYLWVCLLSISSILFAGRINLHPQNRYFTLIALLVDAIVMLSPYKSDACFASQFLIQRKADAGAVGAQRCIRYFNTEAVSSTMILATVDFILVLRVWLLYEKARWLLYVLVPMIGLEILTMALVSHFTIYTTKVFWPIGWPLTGCYPLGLVPRYFTFYSLPVLIVSATMFILTVYKCGKTLLIHGRTRARMPIYSLFLRDGVFWFVAIFATFLPEVVIWAAARQSLAELMIAPGLAVTSIIGSRVLLNIKRLAPVESTALPTTTITPDTDPSEREPMTTIELDTIDYPSRIPWTTVGSVPDTTVDDAFQSRSTGWR